MRTENEITEGNKGNEVKRGLQLPQWNNTLARVRVPPGGMPKSSCLRSDGRLARFAAELILLRFHRSCLEQGTGMSLLLSLKHSFVPFVAFCEIQ